MQSSCGPVCQPTDRNDPTPSVVCGPRGETCLDPRKSYTKWYEGGFLGVNNAFPAVVPGNGTLVATLRATAQDNNAGNLVLSQLVGIGATSFKLGVRLYSQWLDRYFSNVAIPYELIFGTPIMPGLFLGKLFVKAGTALKAEYVDFSGSNNSVYGLARGFRNLIGPGTEQGERNFEIESFDYYRKFVPYLLGPDLGPQVPTAQQTAVAGSGGQQQITLTCPSDGDFHMVAAYIRIWDSSSQNPVDPSTTTIVSWSESGASSSFIDPVLLPLRSDAVFASSYLVSGMFGDSLLRASQVPGGWGGDPWASCGQWVHRLHRGTQMQITLQNNNSSSVRYSVVFVGYLATCDSPPGEFLAFPQSMGQISRPINPVMPGDPNCAPGTKACSMPIPGGRVIVAPQSIPGGQPGISGACPPPRIFPPRRQQFQPRQSW